MIVTLSVAVVTGISSYLVLSQLNPTERDAEEHDPLFGWEIPDDIRSNVPPSETERDPLFGWKYPTTGFPDVGSEDEDKLAYSDIRDPGGIIQGLPVRLKVPVIGVNSAIEDAFITPEGRMDVPSGSRNVAWFALGPNPGQTGSAVIGGHYGIRSGVPFVFYNLDKLVVGDKIYIEDDRGDTLAFQVRKIELFGRNDDATRVFTSNDGLAHLNLITCEGIWNRVNGEYPLRRVVFTDAIPNDSSPARIEPEDSIEPIADPFYRTLNIGHRGADVVELQTFLEKKGVLIIPAGISKGYFGPLTRSAVARYQTSVGLPATGVFDSVTKNKLISEQFLTEDIDSSIATFSRTLSIGNRGTEVVALQTILEQNGFLVIPAGVAKGYYGPLTRSAVARYQTSVGLPATGIFDSVTQNKLVPEVEVAKQPTPPELPETALDIDEEISDTALNSLFATPLDVAITSLLLLSILFVVFRITRRV